MAAMGHAAYDRQRTAARRIRFQADNTQTCGNCNKY